MSKWLSRLNMGELVLAAQRRNPQIINPNPLSSFLEFEFDRSVEPRSRFNDVQNVVIRDGIRRGVTTLQTR